MSASTPGYSLSQAGARRPAGTGDNIKLSIRGASKSYGAVTALAEASLELAEGELLTLLGPSGSGKTTLLMMVAGLVPPSSGEIWIDGKLATYTPPDKRDIGIVFQNYALFPHLTVFENIAFPLRMRRMRTADIAAAVARALDIVQLPQVAGRLPRELSGGQQQRIALARCMVYSPSIILMDEPLGALDRQLRDQMPLEIKSLHRRLGITVLYVTHDQDEAMAMSDRICLLNHGRIEQIPLRWPARQRKGNDRVGRSPGRANRAALGKTAASCASSRLTRCWREMDSNHRYPANFLAAPSIPPPSLQPMPNGLAPVRGGVRR